MKTIILYYSYKGHTKARAEELAKAEAADIVEIKDKKRPNLIRAGYGGFRNKPWAIEPLSVDLTQYDRIILMSSVWAGHPTPAFNAVLADLPSGKNVDVKLVSGGGATKCQDKIRTALSARGCEMTSFEDIKG
jgi:hypothetical protein